VVSFVITSMATTAWSFSYNIRMWRQVVAENEMLQQENLEAEFERVKKQVNPHFLLNSLTSISTLIDEDPLGAERFIDEMCKVYRYLLRDSEKGLIKLEEEVGFIRAYYFLLKRRYDRSIEISFDVYPDFKNHLIPIHTLQMLVDNAIKHNKTLRESPLTIKITTTPDGNLEVVNNLQRKVIRMDAAPIGLNNIRHKYAALTRKEISVKEDASAFSVIIPLIEA
jgi:two-component system LytT family sensor kinase